MQDSPGSGKGKEYGLFLGKGVTNDRCQGYEGKQDVAQPVGSWRKFATPCIQLVLHRWMDEQAMQQAPEGPEENCDKHALAVPGTRV